MDLETELFKIQKQIEALRSRLEQQRVEFNYTTKYFKQYVKEITIPKLKNNLDYLSSTISDLENKIVDNEI